MSKRTVQTLILLVDNEFGVLTRVTALVRREGWNIKSLAVAETINPAFSRLTISVECLDSTLPDVLQRIRRLACVRELACYRHETHINRELVLAIVDGPHLEDARAIAAGYGAKVEELAGRLLLEFAGPPVQVDGLLQELRQYGLRDVARSGAVTLEQPVMEGVG